MSAYAPDMDCCARLYSSAILSLLCQGNVGMSYNFIICILYLLSSKYCDR